MKQCNYYFGGFDGGHRCQKEIGHESQGIGHSWDLALEAEVALKAETQFNNPNDPDSEIVIDDEPPHISITVGELRKRRAHEAGKE